MNPISFPSSPLLCAVCATLFLLTLSASAESAGATSPPEPAEDLSVERENAERGHYRLRGQGVAPISPARALEILSAFDQHCAEGCRWPVSSLDHVEMVDHEAGDDRFTWTEIDDVMDATYFQRARRREVPDGFELTIEIPEVELIEALSSSERSHKPFFESQRVTWSLTAVAAADGAEGATHTRIDVEMEMRSDSFLINMAPKRVLEGAEQNLQQLFDHLRADALKAGHESETGR